MILKNIEHDISRKEIEAERTLIENIGAGCTVPMGALGKMNKQGNKMSLIVLNLFFRWKKIIKA